MIFKIIGQTSSDTLKKLKFSNMSLEQAYPETSRLASQEMPQYGGEDPGGYTPQGRILYWYHPDYIQNVDLITDIDGAAYELFLYNPWGEQLHHWTSSSSSWTSPYRFNAKELDPETGLSYYGARYYQNKMGMWLSVDPLGKKYPSISPYAYVDNNPVRYIDPDGRMTIDALIPPTDIYNKSGKKIGTDGIDNGVQVVVTNNREARQISKTKGNIDLSTVKSVVALPSNATLQESVNVIDRTVANGGFREESSIVIKDGTVVQGQTGTMPTIDNGVQTATASLPNLPAGATTEDVEATIHSHPTTIQQVGNMIYLQSANTPSETDKVTFSQYNKNIIVGPLGTVNPNSIFTNPNGTLNVPNRPNGAVFYDRNASNQVELTKKAIQNILKN